MGTNINGYTLFMPSPKNQKIQKFSIAFETTFPVVFVNELALNS